MTPGIHSMPAEAYHAAEGVSRSMLEDIAPPSTPAHYHSRHILKENEQEESPALRMGSLVHRAVLEPETMEGAFVVKPDGLSFVTKEGKAWKAEQEGKAILTAKEAAMLDRISQSVRRHPAASRLLKGAEFERSLFAEDKGLLLKSRFDILPKTGNVIADLKTCERADLDSVEKSIGKYGYHRQAAFYLKVANLLGLERTHFVFIFVEKTPPYAVACYSPLPEIVEAGRMCIEADLLRLRQCVEADRWPAYSDGIEGAGLPAWQMKQLESL